MTRVPVVHGLGPRVGASTVAAALHMPSAPPASVRPARAAMLTGPVSGWPSHVASTPAPVLDDDALEAEVLAAARPRIRAVHRPVMGSIATAEAG